MVINLMKTTRWVSPQPATALDVQWGAGPGNTIGENALTTNTSKCAIK